MKAAFFAGVSLSLMTLFVGCTFEGQKSSATSTRFATLDSMMEAAVAADAIPVDSVMMNQELNPREANWYQGLAFGVEKPDSNGPLPPGTFFWGGYFNTTYAADPQSQTIGILMKQTYRANDPTSAQFLNEVFGPLR